MIQHHHKHLPHSLVFSIHFFDHSNPLLFLWERASVLDFFVDFLCIFWVVGILKIYFQGEMLLEGFRLFTVWIHECK